MSEFAESGILRAHSRFVSFVKLSPDVVVVGLVSQISMFCPCLGGQGFFSDWVVCVWGGGFVFLGPFSLWEGLSGGGGWNFCQFGL